MTSGTRRPYAVWARGSDLRSCCAQAVSVVGSRAATAYGTHIATEIAADLAERGWAIISGAAYGIDAAAHHGALLPGGRTIAVLACGADVPYPYGHATLLATIAASGTILSEYPPGRASHPDPVPGPEPDHRRLVRWHRGSRSRAGQRHAEHRTSRPRTGPPGDGGARPGHLQPVRRLPPAHPRRRGCLRHQRCRRPHPHRRRQAAATGAPNATPETPHGIQPSIGEAAAEHSAPAAPRRQKRRVAFLLVRQIPVRSAAVTATNCGWSLIPACQPAPLPRFPQPGSRCARPGGQRSFPRPRPSRFDGRLRRRFLFGRRWETSWPPGPPGMPGPSSASLPPDRREGHRSPRAATRAAGPPGHRTRRSP